MQSEIAADIAGVLCSVLWDCVADIWRVLDTRAGVSDTRYNSFSESVAIAGVPTTIRSGAGSDLDWIFGGVANVGLSYRISRRARIRIGLQYQKLGTTGLSVGGKTARIGFNDSISVSAGANWSF